jgi:hypothetical protein
MTDMSPDKRTSTVDDTSQSPDLMRALAESLAAPMGEAGRPKAAPRTDQAGPAWCVVCAEAMRGGPRSTFPDGCVVHDDCFAYHVAEGISTHMGQT